MKKITTIIIPILFLFIACEKKASYTAEFDYNSSANNSFVKFVNAYAYATPLFAGQTSASIQLAYNGVQFSGTPIALGGAFPGNANYAAVPKENSLKEMFVRLGLGTPPAAVKDSFLFAFQPNLTQGKYYTYFFCDSITNLSKRLLITEDEVREPGGINLYRIRFVNLIPNMPVATPTLELFSFRARAVIFTGIPSRGVTPFIEVPVQGINTSDTLQIRYSGTTTTIATLNGLGVAGQASITVFARGIVGGASPRNPTLSSYRNR
jgi:hypothetical protein